jgi:hypothetical protein
MNDQTPPACVVCLRPGKQHVICDLCSRSLAKVERDDMSTAALIEWAAKRARRFAMAALKGRDDGE